MIQDDILLHLDRRVYIYIFFGNSSDERLTDAEKYFNH